MQLGIPPALAPRHGSEMQPIPTILRLVRMGAMIVSRRAHGFARK